jgi:hypothetical protein
MSERLILRILTICQHALLQSSCISTSNLISSFAFSEYTLLLRNEIELAIRDTIDHLQKADLAFDISVPTTTIAGEFATSA